MVPRPGARRPRSRPAELATARPQVVVAVRRTPPVAPLTLGARNEQGALWISAGVAYVRHVQRARAGGDRGIEDLDQELAFGGRRPWRRNSTSTRLQGQVTPMDACSITCSRLMFNLCLRLQRAGRDEGVDTQCDPARRARASTSPGWQRARAAMKPHLAGDRSHRAEIGGELLGKPDHVDAELQPAHGEGDLLRRALMVKAGDCSPSRSMVSKTGYGPSPLVAHGSSPSRMGRWRRHGRSGATGSRPAGSVRFAAGGPEVLFARCRCCAGGAAPSTGVAPARRHRTLPPDTTIHLRFGRDAAASRQRQRPGALGDDVFLSASHQGFSQFGLARSPRRPAVRLPAGRRSACRVL